MYISLCICYVQLETTMYTSLENKRHYITTVTVSVTQLLFDKPKWLPVSAERFCVLLMYVWITSTCTGKQRFKCPRLFSISPTCFWTNWWMTHPQHAEAVHSQTGKWTGSCSLLVKTLYVSITSPWSLSVCSVVKTRSFRQSVYNWDVAECTLA